MIVGVSDDVLTDKLWQRLAALLPPRPRQFGSPGRRAVDDRTVLAGIVWVLHRDVPRRRLPASFGMSGVPCGRRLADWPAAGVGQARPAAPPAGSTCPLRSSTPPLCMRSPEGRDGSEPG